MDIEFLRNYCLSKSACSESTPFNADTLVFKVADKMFALFSISHFESINLKCDPDTAQELRSKYMAVTAGFHMNKRHWNTIAFGKDMTDNEVLEWIDHSYELVVSGMSQKHRRAHGL